MKILMMILAGLLVAGCATDRKPLSSSEQARGQTEVLTSRRDGVSFYQP